MKLNARTPTKAAPRTAYEMQQQRRERWLRDRSDAQPLRRAYPTVEQVRINLSFADRTPHVPAAQGHTLNPPSQAFFRFPCPCVDCDSEFDLSVAVIEMLDRSGVEATGQLECHGVRARDKATGQHCLLKLRYHISATYHSPGKPSSKKTS